MKNYYKIENELPVIGAGTEVPEGFKEYTVGKEPKELLDSIKLEQFQNEKQNRINELKTLLEGSDYWELPTYRADKTNEQNQANDAQRIEWRREIRELEND